MIAQSEPTTDDANSAQYSARCEQYPWPRISEDLDRYGAAVLPGLLSVDQCKAVTELFSDTTLSRTPPLIDQRGWGTGEYRYFHYPLPDLAGELRTALYPHLAAVANNWNERMEVGETFPKTYRQYLQTCHRAGQTVPTSMLLDHAAGDYTYLHQDIYGASSFPLQVAVLLSRPGKDFSGGEFVIMEQRPRMQTRPEVVALRQGDAVALAVSYRPVSGTRGTYRVNLRHGFSKVRTGRLRALNIVFHDAGAWLADRDEQPRRRPAHA